jgi:hypothetical protein
MLIFIKTYAKDLISIFKENIDSKLKLLIFLFVSIQILATIILILTKITSALREMRENLLKEADLEIKNQKELEIKSIKENEAKEKLGEEAPSQNVEETTQIIPNENEPEGTISEEKDQSKHNKPAKQKKQAKQNKIE